MKRTLLWTAVVLLGTACDRQDQLGVQKPGSERSVVETADGLSNTSPDIDDGSSVSQEVKLAAMRGENTAGTAAGPTSTTIGSLSLSSSVTTYNVASIPFVMEATPSNIPPNVTICDDCTSGLLPIGFTFNFYGVNYTHFNISSNGYIGFEAAMSQGCCSGRPLPLNDGINNLIALFWTDLYPPLTPNRTPRYETRGAAPNRRLVVEFKDIAWCCGGAPQASGQIVIHEGSNNIELHTDYQNAGHFYTQGIEDGSGTQAAFVTGRTNANYGLSHDGRRFTTATLNAPPTASTIDAVGIEGTPVTLSATVSDPNHDVLTVVWNFGDGTPAETVTYPSGTTAISRTHVYANNGAFNLPTLTYSPLTWSIAVSDGNGGTVSDAGLAQISNVTPSLTFDPPTQTIVAGSAASFSYSFTDPGTEPGGWQIGGNWGDGNAIPTAAAVAPGTNGSLSHIFATPGTYTVQLLVREANEVVGGALKAVTVVVSNRAPVIDACGPFTGVEGSPVAMSCVARDPDGDPLTYEWKLEATVLGESTTLTHTFTDNNPALGYQLFFTARDTRGASATVLVPLTIVNANPTAAFSAQTPVNEGSSFTLELAGAADAGSSDITSLQLFYDCGTGTFAGPSTGPINCATSDNGTHHVRGRVRDKDGGFTDYDAIVTVANVAPTGTLVIPPGAIPEGSQFGLNLSPVTEPGGSDRATLKYEYDCDDGAGYRALTGALSPGVICPATQDGVRNVKARISDKDGASNEYTGTVTINNVLPAVSSANTLTVVSMTPLGFSGGFSDPGADSPWTVKFDWGESTPTVSSATAAGPVNATHTYNVPGTYTITLSVSDDDGTASKPTTLTVENRLPIARIVGVPGAIECNGQQSPVALDGSGSSDPEGFPLTYEWSEGGVPFSSSASASRSCAVGSHTITLKVSDPHGGSSTTSVTFNVVDTTKPVVTLSVNSGIAWPPNHKYVEISLTKAMSDVCTPTSALVVSGYVVSNEPDEETGDGNFTGDIKVTRGGQIFLSSNTQPRVQFNPFTDKLEVRSERSGTQRGRIYTVVMTVRDAAGNETEVRAEIKAPHDQGS